MSAAQALIIVDVQKDFCEGGALAVPGAQEIMPVIHSLLQEQVWQRVIVTRDYHPAGHLSFASSHNLPAFSVMMMPYGPQTLWPDHCVQGTEGAAFHPSLVIPEHALVLRKGVNPAVDSYSAVIENDKKSVPRFHSGPWQGLSLVEGLQREAIHTLTVVGLALDYCVGDTAADLRAAGFAVTLQQKACRGLQQESIEKKLQLLKHMGVCLI